MKVKTNANILYRGEIYDAGKEFEMDDVTARVFERRGTVKILSGKIEEETPAAGLPPLEVGKKKK